MLTVVSTFDEILSHVEYPQEYFFREPVRDAQPLYFDLDAGYAGLAGTEAAQAVIGAGNFPEE
jgi:hypothetical protein